LKSPSEADEKLLPNSATLKLILYLYNRANMEWLISVNLLPEALEFVDSLDEKTREKIFFNIKKTRMGLTGEWFQKMTGTDDIWEFRTLYNRQYIRLFAFWDKRDKRQTLIICTHGLMKTTAKTPKSEIVHAEQEKAYYFNK
jgi:phage-related protein